MVDSNTFQGSNLKKTYAGRAVVNDVSLNVRRGEIVGLLGPNGAGKTTSFYMMVGLVRPDSGEITLNNMNINRLPIYKRALLGVGYLPQEASVFRELSVEENIAAVCETIGLKGLKKRETIERLLKDFGLEHIKKSMGASLSGGERRRVEIARTLALNPKFILLDEPFAGVDPLAVNDIKNLVGHLKQMGIGILITDHNVRETLSLVDRAYIMNSGEILVEGPPDVIINDPKAKKFYLGEEFTI
jgi:lipopolysaccharide export system ATP-binding protein